MHESASASIDAQISTAWAAPRDGGDWARLAGPWFARTAYLDLGHLCNQQCRYCIQAKGRFRFQRARDFEPELTRARRLGAEDLVLIGGEPLLFPELFPLVEMIRALGFARWGVMTNGTTLTNPWKVDRLAAAGLGFAQVSFDSPRPAVQNALAGNARLSEQLREAFALLPRLAGALLSFNAVLTAWNVDHLDEVVETVAALPLGEGQRRIVMLSALKPPAAGPDPELAVPLGELTPALTRAFAAGRRTGQAVFARSMPYCHLPDGDARRAADYWTRLVLAINAPLIDAPEETGEKHPPACASCRWRPRCPAVLARYDQTFADPSFVPRPVPAPR